MGRMRSTACAGTRGSTPKALGRLPTTAGCRTERPGTHAFCTVRENLLEFNTVGIGLITRSPLVFFEEEYFPCKDLGTDLAPVIERFQRKEAELRRSSIAPLAEPPILADPAAPDFGPPIAFAPWIVARVARGPGAYTLCQGKEKTVRLVVGSTEASCLASHASEGLLWQWAGQAVVRTSTREVILSPGDMFLVTAEEQPARITQGHAAATLTTQNLAAVK